MDEFGSFEIWQSLLARCFLSFLSLCSFVAVKCNQTAFLWRSFGYINHITM